MSLSIDDKQDVLEALFDARSKWRFIGGALGLRDGDLEAIAIEKSSLEDRLDRVIARWLNKGVNCTWEAVSAALRSRTVEMLDLAKEIDRKYLPQTRPSVDPVPPSVHTQDEVLTKDDLLEVSDYLLDLDKSQLKTLGLVLGLTPNTVDDTFESSSVVNYRQSILKAWLMQQDKVGEKGIPTWRVLVQALENKQLRQNGIARRIKNEKKC